MDHCEEKIISLYLFGKILLDLYITSSSIMLRFLLYWEWSAAKCCETYDRFILPWLPSPGVSQLPLFQGVETAGGEWMSRVRLPVQHCPGFPLSHLTTSLVSGAVLPGYDHVYSNWKSYGFISSCCAKGERHESYAVRRVRDRKTCPMQLHPCILTWKLDAGGSESLLMVEGWRSRFFHLGLTMSICSDRIKWLGPFPAVRLGKLQTTFSINKRYHRDSVF